MTKLANKDSLRAPILAGIAYFALVFALGFLLGTVRTVLVRDAPIGARLVGVLIELPIMIGASWFMCRHLIRRFAVASTVTARSAMGGLAFALLLLAELAVGAILFGRTPAEHLALYRDASYALGLAAQVAFGLMPLLQLKRARAREPIEIMRAAVNTRCGRRRSPRFGRYRLPNPKPAKS
jgi:hypothetical protein